MAQRWMIYGATGYTGRLIVELADRLGQKDGLVVAGRNAQSVNRLAERYAIPDRRSFALDDPDVVAQQIQDCELVLHCAGPFVNTVASMAQACLKSRTHYLDITGEIPVFQHLQLLDQDARQAEIVLLPGVGFDIVPTDCLALRLRNAMPDAVDLELAFIGVGSPSGGTTQSALGQAPYGSMVRREGKLERTKHLEHSRQVKFGERTETVYGIPWGDVFTAFYTTGIPNITVFTHLPASQVRFLRYGRPLLGLLKNRVILRGAQGLVRRFMDGPDETTRNKSRSYLWGRVVDAAGRDHEDQLQVPDGYSFTASSALLAVKRVLAGPESFGYQTPAALFGSDFVLESPGSQWTGGAGR